MKQNIGAFSFIKIICAGIAGTAVMTLFIHQVSRKSNRKMKVVPVLGTMLTGETSMKGNLSDTPEVYVAGNLAHYLVGTWFAISYLLLWKYTFLKPDFRTSVFLGAISGIMGIGLWKLFLSIHPDPPKTPVHKYLLVIFIGHVVFGISTTYAFRFFQGEKDLKTVSYSPESRQAEPEIL